MGKGGKGAYESSPLPCCLCTPRRLTIEQTEPAFNGFLQLLIIAFLVVVNIHVINKAARNPGKMITDKNVFGGLGCFLCSLDPLQPHPCRSLIQGLGGVSSHQGETGLGQSGAGEGHRAWGKGSLQALEQMAEGVQTF